ncbi:hypothetical protein JCM11491_000524 [Sporobolomyces phaffii]
MTRASDRSDPPASNGGDGPTPSFATRTPHTHVDEGLDEENSLTAALVAALVQTRDGPPPGSAPNVGSSTSSPSSVAARATPGRGENAEGGHAVDGFESVVEASMEPDHGTTTRSGRRTRPTPAALLYAGAGGGGVPGGGAHSNASSDSNPDAAAASQYLAGRNKSTRVRWTPAEDEELVKLIKEEPPLTWTQMGERLGRPGAGCAMRWYNFVRQQVGEAEADELSNKIRGKVGNAPHARVNPQNEQELPAEEDELTEDGAGEDEQVGRQGIQQALARDAIAASDAHAQSSAMQMQPSDQMQVGSSRTAVAPQQPAPQLVHDEPQLPVPPPLPENYYPGGYQLTGQVLNLATIPFEQLPPRLPPDPSKPGHPFPRTGTIHSNSGPNYLPDQALVKDPPIPFIKNTVIRGRRTVDADTLQASIEKGAPTGKQKKVHPCPADNCGAAFKRSEHLKRHYKSVHRGEKPFPCKIADCGKSFSRKDNLQQHQAMVHGVRAVYTYSDGTVSVNPPDGDEDPVDISYEAVDITKTARGAARQARQEARAKKAETKKQQPPAKRRRGSSSSKKQVDSGGERDDHDHDQPDNDDDDAEGEEDDLTPEQVPPPPPPPASAAAGDLPLAFSQHRPFPYALPPSASAAASASARPPPSTVQDLMSSTSAVSIGPNHPVVPARSLTNGANGTDTRPQSARSESHERGGASGYDANVGDKRSRENGGEGPGAGVVENGVDKRLRLTGGDGHELDPALRVLADATAAVSSGRPPPPPPPAVPNGLSPLIQHALEQRLHQPVPRDIPVIANPYTLTGSNPPASRPFATSSSVPARARPGGNTQN